MLEMNNNLSTLNSLLSNLRQHGGLISLSIKDYYIQVEKDVKSNSIYIEAVSFNFLDILPKSIISDFNSLGFSINDGNFYKWYLEDETPTILNDVEFIFENIYKINFEIPFVINDDIDYTPYHSNKNQSSQAKPKAEKNKNKTNPIIIFILAAIVCYFIFAGNDSSKSHFSEETKDEYSYVIKTEAFATTNEQDHDDMISYFVQKDLRAVETMQLQNKIIVLPAGTEVFLVDYGLSTSVIRVKGTTQKLWISSEMFTKK